MEKEKEKEMEKGKEMEKIELDKIYNMDCLEGMKMIPDKTVDCIITSPPYDNLRTYGGTVDKDGFTFETFKAIANELTRVLADGGVIIWNVSDATIDGSETCSSFRQALYFHDECGLRLHDTMLYQKENYIPLTHNRYEQAFEYLFCFSKGRPKAFNPITVQCKNAGKVESYGSGRRSSLDGKQAMRAPEGISYMATKETKYHSNIFSYVCGLDKTGHPAAFPLKMAREMVMSWSNEGDIVLDPFMGSGTTAVACVREKRHFIGFELNEEYYKKAVKRVQAEQAQMRLF